MRSIQNGDIECNKLLSRALIAKPPKVSDGPPQYIEGSSGHPAGRGRVASSFLHLVYIPSKHLPSHYWVDRGAAIGGRRAATLIFSSRKVFFDGKMGLSSLTPLFFSFDPGWRASGITPSSLRSLQPKTLPVDFRPAGQ